MGGSRPIRNLKGAMPTSHYHSVQVRIAAFEPRAPVQCYEHAVLGDLLRLTTKARTWNLDLWGRFIVLEIASQELVISCFSLDARRARTTKEGFFAKPRADDRIGVIPL